ncbi:hypothetical protein BGZ95_005339 [Linnemannia exigua]|uniref:Ion transport domain-containing protein n=1 Tax=Linnemannia exigua TaxID=604196 RepID=A0AAD4H8P1_9FUNG|nr:hypothetical protein BGZ95_005339 [Linnemannia exigua]
MSAHPPITLTSATKYLKWTIPIPTPPVKRTHYDVVLGIATKNLNLDAIEAIIITIEHKRGDDSIAKSEVITSQELRRLCLIKIEGDDDDTSTGLEDSKTNEITTTTAKTDDPCFRWKLHEKLINLGENPAQLAMEMKTWHGESPNYGSIELHYVEILTESHKVYEAAHIHCTPPDMRSSMEDTITNNMLFYKVEVDSTEVPEGSIAGSGFRRFNVEERCSGIKNLFTKAAFHIVAIQKQDVKDELFVTCDGVTIEVYSAFGGWSHLLSILMDPIRNSPEYANDVTNSLRNNLRGSFLVMRDCGAHQVTTWNIERGIRQSSYTKLTYDQLENINDYAAMSKDGGRIAIPNKHQVDIFWTASWTMAVNYTFWEMGNNPSIRSVQFVRNDMQIMVALDYRHLPFYQRYRGFILDCNSVSLVEEYIAEGCDAFRMVLDNPTSPRAICVGDSQLSLFNLEDRAVLSPTRLKRRCGISCRSIASFKDQGFTEATAPSGLRFKAVKSKVSVVIHGCREDLPVLNVTVSDLNGQPIQMASIPLPKFLTSNSYTFVNECSYLLISLNKLVMVWKMPTSPQEKLTLQLVHGVYHPTDWKVCPHRQVYGLRTQEQDVIGGIDLDDPITSNEGAYMFGVSHLPLIFENASDVVQQEIIRYIGNKINYFQSLSDSDGDVVQYIDHPAVEGLTRTSERALDPKSQHGEHPKAFELAKVLIDYCICQAKLEKNPHFLVPIRQCLPELTDPEKSYSEIMMKLFRELAYIPVRDRDAIVSHHWIAHPFGLRWRFWRPIPGGLDQFNNQVLHVTTTPTINPSESVFSRDIYLATFDMLWLKSDPDVLSNLLFDLMRAYGLAFNSQVKCYPFDLRTLDNPAIAALVEYKWNTIGWQYWLSRFLIQCAHYALVLTAVIMQVYRHDNESAMNGVFIAIITVSFFLISLEFQEFCRDRSEYFRSVFNVIDLLAFFTPFTASILQLVWSDFGEQNTLLSFSVLFLFLHFSGRYDPVSNGLSNNDVGLHIMLMMFFFFTVILMLNVLIALINHAFDDGDRVWELEWLQNRMRYVESAENATFDRPEFRASSEYFPETIYYTATPIQVRDFRKMTQRIKDEGSIAVDSIVVTDAKSRMLIADTFGGSGHDQQQQQEQEQGQTGRIAGDNGDLMAILKQFQEEQKQLKEEQRLAREEQQMAREEQQRAQQLVREEQQQARAEQQKAYEGLLAVHEVQRQAAEELRKELALLKEQLRQQMGQ